MCHSTASTARSRGCRSATAGRRRLYLLGQLPTLLVYGLLLLPGTPWLTALALPLLGAHYAATDGVLMASASASLPERLRTSGLALLTTVTSLASLASSILVGALWSAHGMEAAFGWFAALLLAAAALGGWSVRDGG